MGDNILYIAIPVTVIVVLKIIYGFFAPIKKKRIKLPGFGYTLIYSDTRDKSINVDSGILVSKNYGLRGKPDFIYRKKQNGNLVPVELKSGNILNGAPHRGDLMQLVAYFFIISDVYKSVPKHGYLIYKDSMFKVKNTRKLRNELEDIIFEMRNIINGGEIITAPNASFVTCRHCICNGTVCEFCGDKR